MRLISQTAASACRRAGPETRVCVRAREMKPVMFRRYTLNTQWATRLRLISQTEKRWAEQMMFPPRYTITISVISTLLVLEIILRLELICRWPEHRISADARRLQSVISHRWNLCHLLSIVETTGFESCDNSPDSRLDSRLDSRITSPDSRFNFSMIFWVNKRKFKIYIYYLYFPVPY